MIQNIQIGRIRASHARTGKVRGQERERGLVVAREPVTRCRRDADVLAGLLAEQPLVHEDVLVHGARVGSRDALTEQVAQTPYVPPRAERRGMPARLVWWQRHSRFHPRDPGAYSHRARMEVAVAQS